MTYHGGCLYFYAAQLASLALVANRRRKGPAIDRITSKLLRSIGTYCHCVRDYGAVDGEILTLSPSRAPKGRRDRAWSTACQMRITE